MGEKFTIHNSQFTIIVMALAMLIALAGRAAAANQQVGINLLYDQVDRLSTGIYYQYSYIGLGFIVNYNFDKIPKHLNYEIPHSDYTSFAYRQPSYGLNLYGLYDVYDSIIVFASFGWCRDEWLTLNKSGATGLYYKSNSTTKDNISYGAGLKCWVNGPIWFGFEWSRKWGPGMNISFVF